MEVVSRAWEGQGCSKVRIGGEENAKSADRLEPCFNILARLDCESLLTVLRSRTGGSKLGLELWKTRGTRRSTRQLSKFEAGQCESGTWNSDVRLGQESRRSKTYWRGDQVCLEVEGSGAFGRER